jgi:hypothetical protein
MSFHDAVAWGRKARVPAAVLAAILTRPAQAWIWPEHRDIAATAIAGMDPAQRRVLDAMWADLGSAGEKNLCPSIVYPGGQPATLADACVDLAAFPALAGDHSCSAGDLWDVVSKEAWTLRVVRRAALAKEWLAAAKTEGEHEDAWNLSHLAMQGVDKKYLTRAEGNNGHFLLPREHVEAHETLEAYVARSVDPVQEVNAIGIYVDFHELALRLASLYRTAKPGERADLARRALLAEGVALHFLEDAFSSGHYAATWGTAAWQKGTHDLYSTIGLTTMTWSGELFASHGDAHMTKEDEGVAAATVRRSFAQLAAAAEGSLRIGAGPLAPEESAIEALDFCKARNLPPAPDAPAPRKAAVEVVRSTPIPAGGEKEIHPPRARADMGPFIGVVAGYGFGSASGGYEAPSGARARSELEIGARFGYGLEGLLTRSMDGEIWAQVALVSDPYQLDAWCTDCPGGERKNSLKPRTPARSGLKLAARMPYYVLPFDLILLAPALYFIDKDSMQTAVFIAANGGLLTLQRRIVGSLGSFQFMAGRQVGVTLFGYTSNEDQFISDAAPPDPGSPFALVKYKSVELDFPLVEYIAPRAFATTLSLALAVQLGFCVEFPQNAVLYQQGDAPYSLGTSWYGYLRLELDARKYF